MKYFSPDYVKFFKELAANNNRDWFEANRKRYETNVKEPFQVFIQALLDKVYKDDDSINIEPKEAIFRINRDVRFSANKSPYKLHMSAVIAKGGRKDMINPGYYLEFSGEQIGFYSGIYMPDTKQLYRVRNYLIEHESEFKKLLKAKAFVSEFGELQGDKSKVIPKEFKEKAADMPLLYNKQFMMIHTWPAGNIAKEDLMEKIWTAYKAAKPMAYFLSEAMQDD